MERDRPDVHVLGPVQIGAGGPRLRGQLALLISMLALAGDAVVGNADLIEQLYGGRREATVEDLRPLVSRLRRLLRELGSAAAIVTEASGFRLSDARTDVAAFEQLAAAAFAASDPARATELAADALDCWRDEISEELAAYPPVVRLTERRAAVVELRFRGQLELGRHRDCLADLLAACRAAPYAEELWRLAIVALYRCGRQAEALDTYHEIRRRLADELGVQPGAPLKRAEAQVLAHAVPPAVTAPAWRSVGEDAAPGALPRYDDRYVTAPDVLSAFAELLAHERQLTVIGPAGVGKTRLVVESLLRGAPRGKDGIIFCELSPTEDGAGVAATIAAAAGVRVPGGMAADDALVHALRDGVRLLVLDTCEHVSVAAGLLSARLLEHCAGLSILATSRAPLRLPNERLWPMPALEAPAAVELFLERARQADASFLGDEETSSSVQELCDRLDGLPLAIELAAAKVTSVAPQDLVARLEQQRLALLGDQSAPARRHSTLRASLAWSYRSLDGTEQRVFRLLGAFAGPFRLADAEALLAEQGDVAHIVSQLVERSLLAVRRVPGGLRYRLLDSLRAYARELLEEAAELDAVLTRHAQLVAARKDELVAAAEGPNDAAVVTEFNELWPELRAAVLWCTASGRRDLAAALVAGLGTRALMWERSEVLAWVDALLADRDQFEQHPRRHEVLATAAMADWAAANFERGLERARRARELAGALGATPSTDLLMAVMLQEGTGARFGVIPSVCSEQIELARRSGNRFAESWLMICVATVQAYTGRYNEALATLEQVDRIVTRSGNELQRAVASFARTLTLLDGDPAAALHVADEAIAAADRLGATWVSGSAANYRAAALALTGDIASATAEVRASLNRLREGGALQSIGNTLRNAITVLDRTGQADRAGTVIGWLGRHNAGIPGSPGMRARVEDVRQRLERRHGRAALVPLLEEGARLTVREILVEADDALARSVEPPERA